MKDRGPTFHWAIPFPDPWSKDQSYWLCIASPIPLLSSFEQTPFQDSCAVWRQLLISYLSFLFFFLLLLETAWDRLKYCPKEVLNIKVAAFYQMAVYLAVAGDILRCLILCCSGDVLGRIWDWIMSVPENFPTYFFVTFFYQTFEPRSGHVSCQVLHR